MPRLSDLVSVMGRFARSANLERDIARTEPLEGYVMTARALDVVERIAGAAARGPSGGAWSLTGPYGSGKSSLALLIDAAFGNNPETRRIALDLIDTTAPSVGNLVKEAHKRYGTEELGFCSGLVTAQREPPGHTILRALQAAVVRSYGRTSTRSSALRELSEGISTGSDGADPSPAVLIDVVKSVAQEVPLLLIIDEFGKNLEAFRDGADADPYLLQQLAEAGQSGNGLPVFVLTLQHLSFGDYLGGGNSPAHREWAKVQGRFEDVAYVESPAQTRALMRTVFSIKNRLFQERVDKWAEPYTRVMRSLGVGDLATREDIASCYPLHPLVALLLPELCSRYGQHERTLFSFLAGPDRSSVMSFLASQDIEATDPLPAVGLSAVYDYFVSNGAGVQQSSRWTEVAVRIRDRHGLTLDQERLLKAIALLNLVSTGGAVRASQRVLGITDSHAGETLAELEAAGIVTYRDFADEYRIWEGTDVDIRRLLDDARRRVERQSLVGMLSQLDDPPPAVAARHSAENQTLRVFRRRYASGGEVVEPLDPSSEFDGEVLLIVDASSQEPTLKAANARFAKPIVAAIPSDVAALKSSAREGAAITLALEDADLSDDWVVRQELGERLAQTLSILHQVMTRTFDDANCQWLLLADNENIRLSGGRGSAPLSQAADIAYPSTPVIRNEMLNRTTLTSQGAKARRILLEAMINQGEEPDLGLSGYGPEMAMYKAVLSHTGMHGFDARNDTRTFRSPADDTLRTAWDLLIGQFRRAKSRRINLKDLFTVLQSPPIGMKKSVVSVFVTAGLLAYSDETAIYEHGTFKPQLTAEMSQRLVRNPAYFEVKHFANTTGARREVIDELVAQLHINPRFRKHRVGNVLAVVGDLIARIRRIENYTRRTRQLSPMARASRDVLLAAVEPDDLLFSALPQALGFPYVSSESEIYRSSPAYARAVAKVMEELESAYPKLLDRLLRTLLETSAETSRLAISGQAAALCGEVLDPKVRAFVLTLANQHIKSDTDWIKTVATVVTQKAPAEWRDEDLHRFEYELPQQVGAFRRLVALHADSRAEGGGPFEAIRVTFTRPNGREDIRLVSVDRRERERIDQELDLFLQQLSRITGSSQRTEHAILALLGERLLTAGDVIDDTESIPVLRVQHG